MPDLFVGGETDLTPILGHWACTLGLQLADAALVHLADREGTRTVLTLDRRDFAVVCLTRGRRLRFIPGVEN